MLPTRGRYLLFTNHTEFAGGNLGVFDAPEPWGPWTTVEYSRAWPAGGEVAPSAFYWNISPKWLDEQDESFVLVFTGIGENDAWNSVAGRLVEAEKKGPAR